MVVGVFSFLLIAYLWVQSNMLKMVLETVGTSVFKSFSQDISYLYLLCKQISCRRFIINDVTLIVCINIKLLIYL